MTVFDISQYMWVCTGRHSVILVFKTYIMHSVTLIQDLLATCTSLRNETPAQHGQHCVSYRLIVRESGVPQVVVLANGYAPFQLV